MPLFKPHLYALDAYQPPLEGRSAHRHLLLDFNERTLPVSPAITAALRDYIQSGPLQKYPAYGDITARLAAYAGVEPAQLMITNGSDQGIDLVIRAATGPSDRAIIPAPSFAIYAQCAQVQNAELIAPPYQINAGYPLDAVLAAIDERTRLIVIPLPNNPSGTAPPLAAIERIAQAAPAALVLVDECYFEYTGLTAAPLVACHPNLAIARTFSKTWGLPALRFGFLLSQEDNIRQLLKIRGPYDVNQLAVVAARAALDSPAYTRDYVREVMEKSKPLLENWLKQRNIRTWPSCANFLWTFPPQAAKLAEHLRTRNILVRPKSDAQGKLGLRISLGTLNQTQRLLEALEDFSH